MRSRLWLCALAPLLGGCFCAGASRVTMTYSGFNEHAGKKLAMRLRQGSSELAGSRQGVIVDTAGRAVFLLSLAVETEYQHQYFIDDNGNGIWDGPLDTGEHSWSKVLIIPAPTRNADSIALTIAHDNNHSAIPPDFTAP